MPAQGYGSTRLCLYKAKTVQGFLCTRVDLGQTVDNTVCTGRKLKDTGGMTQTYIFLQL